MIRTDQISFVLALAGAGLLFSSCAKQDASRFSQDEASEPESPAAAVTELVTEKEAPAEPVAEPPAELKEPTASHIAVVDAEPTDAKISREPYVQLATTDSIYIVWRTDGPITPVVRWGKTPDALDNAVPADAILTRMLGEKSDTNPSPLHSAPEGTRQFEAKITGLSVDSVYYYAVYDSTRLLSDAAAKEEYRFSTLPEPGKEHPLRFWVVGDSGTGGEPPRRVHEAMREYVAKDGRPLDLYVHVGDMAYTHGRDDEFSRAFFRMYEDTLRNVPVWAAMGNHEGHTSKGSSGVGPYYDAYICPTKGEAGGVASGLEAYYSYDFGRVHFIVLDSHDLDRAPTGVMAKWLQEDLEKVNQSDWIVAYFHHPPYTLGSHDSNRESQLIEMRKFIMPILESGGVDVVFTGHSHIYERSMLMDGAYDTPTVAENVILDDGDGDPDGDGAYRKSAGIHPNEGAVQVVAGHGGQGLARKGTMPVMRKIIVENGSVICDVDGNTFRAVMVNLDGKVRDVFSIVKEGTVTVERIASPWQPEPPKTAAGSNKPKPADKPAGAEKGPAEFTTLVPRSAEWRYLVNDDPEEGTWTGSDVDDAHWQAGRAGFGYGDDDDTTVLSDMADRYTTVYVRNAFELASPYQFAKVGLMIRYDDAFIAYVNGKEVLRVGVGEGSGAKAKNVASAEAKKGYTYFPLKKAADVLKVGKNIIAIEGHNQKLGSSDFTLDPYLILEK